MLLLQQVILFVEKNKLPGLRRLLEAGGAQVVTRITAAVLKEVTHAFITMSHFPKEVRVQETTEFKLLHEHVHVRLHIHVHV